jgi:hypothetical protein
MKGSQLGRRKKIGYTLSLQGGVIDDDDAAPPKSLDL